MPPIPRRRIRSTYGAWSFLKYTPVSTCIFRITTLGYGTNSASDSYSCSECFDLVNEGECVEVKKETNADVLPDEKPQIPGLYHGAEKKKAYDKNLAPFSSTDQKILQYGDTNFISINTDHLDWAPGECLNLHKYEGHFIVKTSGTTQPVIHKP